jgi:hypothetical protein
LDQLGLGRVEHATKLGQKESGLPFLPFSQECLEASLALSGIAFGTGDEVPALPAGGSRRLECLVEKVQADAAREPITSLGSDGILEMSWQVGGEGIDVEHDVSPSEGQSGRCKTSAGFTISLRLFPRWLQTGTMGGDERQRLKELERENFELRRANESLKKASAYFAQAELDRRAK